MKTQKGLTLIEVLIALLVLSIGLVGIAAINVASMSAAHSAYYRSLASFMAQDAEERLWVRMAEQERLPTATDVAAVETAWVGTWDGYMPGLDMALTRLDPGETNSTWVDVAISVTWQEGRFGAAVLESFEYLARVYR